MKQYTEATIKTIALLANPEKLKGSDKMYKVLSILLQLLDKFSGLPNGDTSTKTCILANFGLLINKRMLASEILNDHQFFFTKMMKISK